LIICFLRRFKAARENLLMFVTLSFPKIRFSVTIPFSEATAIHTVPTGFEGVPPSGPAIPEVATV
jgi:hypothetical protein